MPKFFVQNNQIKNGIISITGDDVNHIVNVLRLKKQDNIYVCDKDKQITYDTKIVQVQKEEVKCEILNRIEQNGESNIWVTIFQGLPKADKMEYIIQKTTELGVKQIIPVNMKRCVVKLNEKDVTKKIDRWNKIAQVAAKQCGRSFIPDVKNPINIDDLCNMVDDFDFIIVAYENEKDTSLKEILKNIKSKSILKIGVVIGPEGGLEEDDVIKLEKKGAKIITLGNRILRTETAPVVILSNIMYELEN